MSTCNQHHKHDCDSFTQVLWKKTRLTSIKSLMGNCISAYFQYGLHEELDKVLTARCISGVTTYLASQWSAIGLDHTVSVRLHIPSHLGITDSTAYSHTIVSGDVIGSPNPWAGSTSLFLVRHGRPKTKGTFALVTHCFVKPLIRPRILATIY